jgi:hypothetical protein
VAVQLRELRKLVVQQACTVKQFTDKVSKTLGIQTS